MTIKHMNDDYGQFIDISEIIDLPNKIINNPTTIHPQNTNIKPKPKQKHICIHFFNYNFIIRYNRVVCLFIVGVLFFGTKIYYF